MAVPGKKATKPFSSLTTSMSSDEDIKLYCQPCDRDGLRLPARGYCANCSEHLCETCFTLHRRHTLSIHHTLLDKTNMPQTLSPATTRQPDNFTKPCPKHNIEMIKFYCHDHKALLCSVCVTLQHAATSCKVNYIPDISGQVINSTEYHHILKNLNDMDERSNKTLQDMKQLNEVSNKSLTEVFTYILRFRTRLDEIERNIMKAAAVIQENNGKNLKSVETACGDVSKSLKACSDVIKHFNASKKVDGLFMELKHAEQMINEYEHSVDKLSELEFKAYNLELCRISGKPLGTLKGRTLSPDMKSRQCTEKDRICIKASKDKNDCWISGITLLTPDLLIVTDDINKAVKMVEISKNSVLDQKYFDCYPMDVTSVSQDELAVTLPDNLIIQFFSVAGNKLKEKHTLKVDGSCYGISCHKDKLVVSYLNPAKVQILLINGTVLQTLQDDKMFKSPQYVTTSYNCIYVSDYERRTVTKLNWQCEVKCKYVCEGNPRGLTMSDDGTVFVGTYNCTIEEISKHCSEGQIVVKDIERLRAVYWSTETCTLYASSRYNTEEDYFIKRFIFSK